MGENTHTYVELSRNDLGFATGALLKRVSPLLVTERFGYFDPQPRNKSRTRTFRRYESLPPVRTVLADGVPPKALKVTTTDITVQLEELGAVLELTNRVIKNHQDPILAEFTDLMTDQMRQSVELFRFAALKAGTNVHYAGSVAGRTAVNSTVSRTDLRVIKRGLQRNLAAEITQMIPPSLKTAVEPVAPAFMAFVHTDLDPDLRNVTGFVPPEKYADPGKAIPGEIGKIEGIRFIGTTLLEPYAAAGASGTTYLSGGVAVSNAAAADVYPVLIFGKNAYAICPLRGEDDASVMIVNPGKPASGNPLGQQGSVGWLTDQAAVILNQLHLVRYEVACTANPS